MASIPRIPKGAPAATGGQFAGRGGRDVASGKLDAETEVRSELKLKLATQRAVDASVLYERALAVSEACSAIALQEQVLQLCPSAEYVVAELDGDDVLRLQAVVYPGDIPLDVESLRNVLDPWIEGSWQPDIAGGGQFWVLQGDRLVFDVGQRVFVPDVIPFENVSERMRNEIVDQALEVRGSVGPAWDEREIEYRVFTSVDPQRVEQAVHAFQESSKLVRALRGTAVFTDLGHRIADVTSPMIDAAVPEAFDELGL